MKPADTQCRALVDGERCENDISLSDEGDWLVWCGEHQKQEKVARAEGGARVERVEQAEQAE